MMLKKVQSLNCNHLHTIFSAKDFKLGTPDKAIQFYGNTASILLACLKCEQYCEVFFQ